MGLFSRIFRKENVSISIGGSPDASMLFSKEYPALENSSFWSCVTNLCRTFATLPLHVYETSGVNRSISRLGWLPRLIEHPCPYMDKYQWRWVMTFNFEIHGVAMAIIDRTAVGDPMSLYPVAPSLMVPRWDNGHLSYMYAGGRIIPAEDVFIAHNTPIGYSQVLCPLTYAQKDLDVASNSQRLQTNYFKKGTTIGGTLMVPRGTSQAVKDQLRAMIQGQYAGSENAYKTMVLEDSMKYEPLHLTENDSTKMEQAQAWTLQEVARRFGVPPFFIGDLTKATFQNSEQQGTQLVTYALQPRAVAWETAWDALCGNSQYVKFSLAGLMRGDHAARSAFYHSALMDGWMSINEVRQLEDLNPVKDGDSHYFPLNYTTIDKVGKNLGGTAFQNPASSGKPESVHEETIMTEKRRNDLKFIEETKAVTQSSRSKIEKIIRKQLKAEIDEIKRLIQEGKTFQGVIDGFAAYAKQIETQYGQEYIPAYEEIISRLLPIMQKQVGTSDGIDAEQLKAYASKYAVAMAGRHAASRSKDVSNALKDIPADQLEQSADDLSNHWVDVVPSDESNEESSRAGNAFTLFLMSGLGVSYMHIVASADACEFCGKLDGQVCEVNGTVLVKGTSVSDGEGNVRTINKNMKHPPWHTHCHCGIAPGR